ncbi:MAG: hypothetical protein K8I00_09140 [Candidatus Omnitrophica bacterium]|nr:hypothetical protein [Candidatus Omnitrophota bacterium]
MNSPAQKIFNLVIVCAFLLLGGRCPSADAQGIPQLSSSLAKNLWRQCHMFYEEGMDAKAKRACGELQAWARENNDPAIVQETTRLLTSLQEREQQPAQPAAPKIEKKSELQPDQPACGYASIAENEGDSPLLGTGSRGFSVYLTNKAHRV